MKARVSIREIGGEIEDLPSVRGEEARGKVVVYTTMPLVPISENRFREWLKAFEPE